MFTKTENSIIFLTGKLKFHASTVQGVIQLHLTRVTIERQ